MKLWATRLSAQSKTHHAVKVTQLKLELGLFGLTVGAANDNFAIRITGTATNKNKPSFSSSTSSKPKTTPLSLVPFHRSTKRPCSCTTSSRKFLSSKASSLAWDARDLRPFHLLIKDDDVSLHACHIAFHVLHGEGCVGESESKMTVVGKAEMSVATAEMVVVTEETKKESNSQSHFHRRLPIKLRVNGLCIEAILLVSLKLLKLKDSNDDSGIENYWVESEKKSGGIIGKVKYLRNLGKKNSGNCGEAEQTSPYDSDGSRVFDSDDSSNGSTTSSGSSNSNSNTKSSGIHHAGLRLSNGSERFTNSESKTRLDTVQRSWSHFPRNRSLKECNSKTTIHKQEKFNTYVAPSTESDEVCGQVYRKSSGSSWGRKEISSRDGGAKLKTNVFFASFDQMSEKASGESACTVLVALIAHWLHSNHGMPTRSQFDSLIAQGSSEWRRLCNDNYYSKLFPDKHFDLETIIEANLRPLVVVPQKSYTGFFSPEKFQCLKGAMSFDEIWEEINKNVVDQEPRVYIVSWNDHFFVLKAEAEAYYIIDSLGERLYEGCQKAFILKFDDSSVMYRKRRDKPKQVVNGGAKSEETCEIISRGKECCKEFIKRFLAAIPLWQLEKEEKKWSASSPNLHRQLQIDFHYSSLTCSSANSAATSLWSLLS